MNLAHELDASKDTLLHRCAYHLRNTGQVNARARARERERERERKREGGREGGRESERKRGENV